MARYQEAEQQLQQSMAVVNLSEYRSHLQPDSPCPLCGSLEHPYAEQHPVVEGLLHSQQQRLRELQQLLQNGEGERRHLQQQLPQCLQRLAVIDNELARYRAYSDQIVSQLLAMLEQVELSTPLTAEAESRHLNDQLVQWQQQAEQAYGEIRALQQGMEAAQQQLQQGRQLQYQRQQLQQAEAEIKEHVHQQSQANTQRTERLQSIDQQSQTQQEILSSRGEALNEQYGNGQWLDMLRQHGAEQYIQQLKHQVEQYLSSHKAQQEVERELNELAPQLAELEANMAASYKQALEKQQKAEQLQQQVQSLWQQRVSLFGEQAADAIEQQAKTAVSQAQQQHEQSEQAQRQAGETMAAASAALAGLEQQDKELSAEHRQVVHNWLGWQEKLALNEHQLMQLLSKDEDWLEQEQNGAEGAGRYPYRSGNTGP